MKEITGRNFPRTSEHNKDVRLNGPSSATAGGGGAEKRKNDIHAMPRLPMWRKTLSRSVRLHGAVTPHSRPYYAAGYK